MCSMDSLAIARTRLLYCLSGGCTFDDSNWRLIVAMIRICSFNPIYIFARLLIQKDGKCGDMLLAWHNICFADRAYGKSIFEIITATSSVHVSFLSNIRTISPRCIQKCNPGYSSLKGDPQVRVPLDKIVGTVIPQWHRLLVASSCIIWTQTAMISRSRNSLSTILNWETSSFIISCIHFTNDSGLAGTPTCWTAKSIRSTLPTVCKNFPKSWKNSHAKMGKIYYMHAQGLLPTYSSDYNNKITHAD